MKWLPQSLFARLLAALIGVVGVTLIVIAILIIRERRDLALWGSGAWNAATVIAETSEQLAKLKGEARREAIEKYRAEPIEIERARRDLPPQLERAMEDSERAFAHRLRRQLHDNFKVSVDRADKKGDNSIRVIEEARRAADGTKADADESPRDIFDGEGRRRSRMFDIEVKLPDGERVLFRTNAPAPGPALPKQIFGELSAVTLGLALVLFFMTRSITKPLSALAVAADAIGKGERISALPERGASELRNATRAFNTMQDRLHRYLDSRTRVLAAMSHDLRTPLTRLRLRAETIEDAQTRERITADLDEMSTMITGALGLFKGLNDSEVAAPLNIDEILLSLQREFAELGGEVSISGISTGPLMAKPNAIKRCLSNLLHNAVKYGDRAHVTVTDAAQLQIIIRDEGPGIPEEQLEQVFEPFYRVESSRNRDSGGTGLGLCIARDIAEAHGGTIQLRNLPQQGLEVVLTLPRKL